MHGTCHVHCTHNHLGRNILSSAMHAANKYFISKHIHVRQSLEARGLITNTVKNSPDQAGVRAFRSQHTCAHLPPVPPSAPRLRCSSFLSTMRWNCSGLVLPHHVSCTRIATLASMQISVHVRVCTCLLNTTNITP